VQCAQVLNVWPQCRRLRVCCSCLVSLCHTAVLQLLGGQRLQELVEGVYRCKHLLGEALLWVGYLN
jgi:hypothetical protein